jgi:hypothetical protein
LGFSPFCFQRLRALPTGLNDAGGDGFEREGAVAVPLRALDPANCIGVRGSEQFTADDATEVIGNHIMVADAAVLTVDAVEEFDQFDGFDEEAGLFPDLADNAGGEGLAEFKQAAGEGPVAFQGLGSAADEQDAAAVDDHRANAQ